MLYTKYNTKESAMPVSENILQNTIDAALSTGADFAEVFVEDTYSGLTSVKNSELDQSLVGQLKGAGLRLLFGEETIYVTTNDLTESGLIAAARAAAQSQTGTQRIKSKPLLQQKFDRIHPYGISPWASDKNKKLNHLKKLDQIAREYHSDITQTQPILTEKYQRLQVANSLGLCAQDERAYARLGIDVFAEKNGQKESAHIREGVLGTFDMLEQFDIKVMAYEGAQRALALTQATFAPAGEMPVIIDNGFGGVIFHEACGHGLETTSVAKGTSVFCDKLNTQIAHPCVTAIDDGTIKSSWGSLTIDDEGLLTQKNVLIEKGILKSYLVDYLGSLQTGYARTHSGRRESYKFAPTSRMTNTYLAPGQDSFEEMVRDIEFGLLAKYMGGGSVNPATGDFNFQVQDAYIIRRGRIEELVKGACLIGRGIDTLGRITKVSSDFKLSIGMCGSVSGQVPTTVGQAQILVSKLLVGGRVK
jgi:TldD protein